MKKIFTSIFCAMVIAVLCVACGGVNRKNVSGRWEYTQVCVGDACQDVPAGAAYIEFNSDGSLSTVSNVGQSSGGTWGLENGEIITNNGTIEEHLKIEEFSSNKMVVTSNQAGANIKITLTR